MKQISLVRALSLKITLALAALVLIIGILMAVARISTPYINRYHDEIQEAASKIVGYPIEIGEINLDWRWYRPSISFTQVEVFNEDKSEHLVTAEELSLVIKPLSSLWHRQLQSSALFVSDVQLNLAYPGDEALQATLTEYFEPNEENGLDNRHEASTDKHANPEFTESMAWLLEQNSLSINNLTIHWIGEHANKLPITEIELSVKNRRNAHIIDGTVILKQAIATSVQFNGNFEGEFESGELYFDINRLDFNQWLSGTQWEGMKITKGIGGAQFWLSIEGQQLNSLHGQVALEDVELQPSNQQPNISLDLSAHLDWKQDQLGGWRILGKDIDLNLNNVNWPENKFFYEYRVVDGDVSQRLYIPYIHWKSLWPLIVAGDWFEGDLKETLLSLHPAGEFTDTYLRHMARDTNASMLNQWYLKTNFYQLGWQANQQIPGVQGLSGSLAINPQQGKLLLNSRDLSLSLGGFLPKPVQLATLQGEVNWAQDDEQAWTVTGQEVRFNNDDLSMITNFALNLAEGASLPEVNAEAQFEVYNPTQTANYLPNILDPELYDWIANAPAGNGQATGTIVLRGNLADFPFDNHEGAFIVDANVEGVDFNYFKGWPIINNATGNFVFNNREIHTEISSGTIMGATIDTATIDVNNIGLGLETVFIKGRAEGHANNGVNFVRNSPLIDELALFNQMDAEGDVQLDLDITAPIIITQADKQRRSDEKLLVNGHIQLQDSHLKFLEWPIEASDIEGELAFTQDGISSSDFTSNLFNGPAIVKLETITGENVDKYTQIEVEGTTGIIDLSKQFDVNLLPDYLSGDLPYSAVLKIQENPESIHEMTIHSNLKGLAIHLPEPFSKDPEQVKDFALSAHFGMDQPIEIQLNVDKDWSTHFSLIESQHGYQIGGGELRFGSSMALLPKQAILRIVGTLPYLSISQWEPYLNKVMNEAPSQSVQPTSETQLDLVDLRIKELVAFNNDFKDLDIRLNRINAGWLAHLQSDDILGDIHITDQVQANLEYLNIPANVANVGGQDENQLSASLEPHAIPPLTVVIDELNYDHMPIGRLTLSTTPTQSKLILNQLLLQANDFNLNAEGEWGTFDNSVNTYTNFKGQVNVKNITNVLRNFGVESSITSRDGMINFNIGWPNSPAGFSLEQLRGNLAFKFYYGNITDLDPATEGKLNVGKVFSLLSLSTLPRRLQLDFSDLSSSGYSYDSFEGSFNIKESIAATNDITLDGPVAYLSLNGIVNLADRDYDLNLYITPHVTSSLPVVATIIGGPILGAATWAADRVVDFGFRGVNPYSFAITGDWDRPNVEEVFEEPNEAG